MVVVFVFWLLICSFFQSHSLKGITMAPFSCYGKQSKYCSLEQTTVVCLQTQHLELSALSSLVVWVWGHSLVGLIFFYYHTSFLIFSFAIVNSDIGLPNPPVSYLVFSFFLPSTYRSKIDLLSAVYLF